MGPYLAAYVRLEVQRLCAEQAHSAVQAGEIDRSAVIHEHSGHADRASELLAHGNDGPACGGVVAIIVEWEQDRARHRNREAPKD